MKKILETSKQFFEMLDGLRDKVLNIFIFPLWPRKISPNHLTISRVIISLLLFVLLFYYKIEDGFFIISLFFIGAITDILDGSVARALNKVTEFGTILDPIADRMLIIPIAIYSLFSNHTGLLFFLIFLEFVNASLSIYSQSKKTLILPNIFGKIKMVLQSVVFLAILLFWPKAPNMFYIDILWISGVVMIVSLLVKHFEIKSILELKHEKR